MSAPTHPSGPGESVPTAEPQLPAPGGLARLKWVATGVLLALVAAGVGWWWWDRNRVAEPPLPADITDAEVRKVVERGRAKVVAAPRSADAWGEYGTVLLANLFDREADACFIEAAKRNPKDPRWPYARGQIALKRDPENALVLLTTAADAALDYPDYRQAFGLTLAEALLERGKVDEAEALFKQELRAPDPERAQYGLGLIALSRNDDATANQRFLSAQAHPCCRKQAKAQLALLARVRGDVSAAKQYEAEASTLEQDPPWPDAYLDRVVTLQVGQRGLERRVALLERDRHYAEAAEAYLAPASVKPTSKALTGAGVNLARQGDYDTALGHLREAVQLDPADSQAHYTLALVLFTKWEKVAVQDPRSAEAALGFREVITHAQKTTELKPNHARAYLFWGLALKFLGEPKAALAPFRTGLTVEPELFDLHLGLGQVLAATGDKAGAEASLNTARQLRPNDPRPAEELAKLKGEKQ